MLSCKLEKPSPSESAERASDPVENLSSHASLNPLLFESIIACAEEYAKQLKTKRNPKIRPLDGKKRISLLDNIVGGVIIIGGSRSLKLLRSPRIFTLSERFNGLEALCFDYTTGVRRGAGLVKILVRAIQRTPEWVL